MSEKEQLLKNTKIIIRSLLLTHKDGYTLGQLSSDFKRYEGREIPYQLFGYPTLMLFLKSIPEVATLSQGTNGQWWARAVTDENTGHIARLVQGQNDNRNKKKPGGLGRQSQHWPPPRFQKLAHKTVSAQLRDDILQVMKRNREGLNLDAFQKEFEALHNRKLMWSYSGFTSLQNVLSSAREIVDVRPGPGGIDKVYPNHSCLQRWQIEDSRRAAAADRMRGNQNAKAGGHDQYGVPQEVQVRLKELVNEHPDGIRVPELCRKYKEKFGDTLSVEKYGCPSVTYFCFLMSSVCKTEKKSLSPKDDHYVFPLNLGKENAAALTDDVRIPEKVEAKIKNILLENPRGIRLSKLPDVYMEQSNRPLDFKKYGFDDLLDLVRALTFTETRLVKDMYQSDKEVTVVSIQEKFLEEARRAMAEIDEKSLELERNKKALKKRKKMQPDDCPTPAPTLRHMVEITNLSKKTTIDDLRELISIRGSIIKMEMLDGGRAVAEMETTDAVKRVIDEYDDQDLDGNIIKVVAACEKPSEDSDKKGPKNCIVVDGGQPLKLIQEEPIPEEAKIGGHMEIIVSHTYSPTHFWFQLRKNFQPLDELMSTMDQFYNNGDGVSHSYIIHPANMIVGQYCAALFDGDWHRAMVVDIKDLEYAEIFYIDYGTLHRLRQNELRYLHKQFAHFPAQAIKGSLANIKPHLGEYDWRPEATAKFLELTAATGRQGLVAAIRGISRLTNTAVLWLYDTVTNNDPNGVQINNALHELGFADVYDSSVKDDLEKIDKALSISSKTTSGPRSSEERYRLRPPSFDSASSSLEEDTHSRAMPDKSSKRTSLLNSSQSKTAQAILNRTLLGNHTTEIITPTLDDTKNCLMPVDLDDGDGHLLHIIKLGDEAYLTSAEISGLVKSWKNRDVLAKMLDVKCVSFPVVTVKESTAEYLFEQCVVENVAGIHDSEGRIADQLSLYRLRDVPAILMLFNRHASLAKIIAAVERQWENFDPNDPHWVTDL